MLNPKRLRSLDHGLYDLIIIFISLLCDPHLDVLLLVVLTGTDEGGDSVVPVTSQTSNYFTIYTVMAVHPGGTVEVRVLVHLQNQGAVKDMDTYVQKSTL